MVMPGGAFNLQAQQSLSPGLIAKYGPAWVLAPETWLNYLISIGELPPETGLGPDPEFPGSVRVPARTRYEASPEELEAAFSLANPNQSFYSTVAAHFPSGILPQGFADQWGLALPIAPELEPTQAPQFVGPPTPGFLAGELTGLERGQPLEARPTKFASGQLLQRLTPSQLQGVGGFVNWAAGQVSGAPASYEDWLAGSQQLLPQTRQTVRWGTSPSSI